MKDCCLRLRNLIDEGGKLLIAYLDISKMCFYPASATRFKVNRHQEILARSRNT
jgi:hypothetical protein